MEWANPAGPSRGDADLAQAPLATQQPEPQKHRLDPLVGGEEILLGRVLADRDDKAVEEGLGAPDDVDVAVGDGVEGPRTRSTA